MPRRARIQHASLKSSLVNLPVSIYGPLLERSIVRACFDRMGQRNLILIVYSVHKVWQYT